jgi:hypothetical protein
VRKRRCDAVGLRKDIIIRLPEELAHQLKVVAACEGVTVQDFCERLIGPEIRKSMETHGLSPEQITREQIIDLSNYLVIELSEDTSCQTMQPSPRHRGMRTILHSD